MAVVIPSKGPGSVHRLLYRGSITLPDSYMLLDGLSFTAAIKDMNSSPALLNNPLALTLESMRGLPLHLLGTVKVKDTWIDPPADIFVDIHPDAALTRMYFENIFCLTPITSPNGRTEYGVRVSLTENNDADTPDLLIYGELRDASPSSETSLPSSSSSAPKTLHLLAARIYEGVPPPPTFRLPRPDDPTPRKPPPTFGAKRKRDVTGLPFAYASAPSESNKRIKTGEKGKGKALPKDGDADEAMRKAAAEVMLRMPKPGKATSGSAEVNVKALGKEARVGVKKDAFKVPSVPIRTGKARPEERVPMEADVFGTVGGTPADSAMGDSVIEKENKTAVKKAVTKCLGKHGISKTHIEFKELFQTCYHGASFALRRRMARSLIEASTIDHFVNAHVNMYVLDAPS
ncbi:hypothetical protein PYCCODRAFT_1397057 [Trametes coccinea BRFM310]|uniref:Sld7 C-terminal domain-containing protein n=1 Tax=Trametes coccinea (strain BRFM310) TaxID=1353009 RepID=A0A1Y2IEV4_TRAC3|nr:hypothetical protein PYCCODRAFT_1397057 [Trametes coccinea BRFM310]